MLHISCLFRGSGLGKSSGRSLGHGFYVREATLYFGKHHIDMMLVLEGALHALAPVVLHNKIGNGTENSLARESALAHGHALVGTLNVGHGNIESALHEKTVQIQGLVPDPAGAEYKTGLSVVQSCAAQLGRFEVQHHNSRGMKFASARCCREPETRKGGPPLRAVPQAL